MFNILPSPAVPSDVPLTDELKTAQAAGRKIFENLKTSPERDSILALSVALEKAVSSKRIRHRARLVHDAAAARFPELFAVCDEAVNCRNHYVHGGDPGFDYNANFNAMMFFTDTLEFVFAASDLIEAGWDLKAWRENPTTMSHPFAAYRVNYAAHLQKLKRLLP
jgi:hypothetical protein